MNRSIQSVLGLVALSGALSACSSSDSSDGNGTVGGTGYGGAQSTGGNANTAGLHAGGSTGVGADLTATCNLEGQIAAQLNCPGFTSQQAVVSSCMLTPGVPASCQSSLDSLTACYTQQPTSSFQCASRNDGTVAPKSGVCTSQITALGNCSLGGTGTGCSDLAACCSQLTGTNQTDCQQIVSQAIDAACGIALSTFQQTGICT
jgi:hypothetical protein